MTAETILFTDISTQDKCSAYNTNIYKDDGIYVGEAVIKRRRNDGLYEISACGNRLPIARPVFNLGENIFPIDIPVFVIIYNAEAWILGRMRAIKDESESDGSTSTDVSPEIGTPGDAMLRPHASDDKDPALVRVTRGGVVTVRSSKSTNLSLQPHTEMFRWTCKRLLGFSDAYRIESGRYGSYKAGLKEDVLTEETYRTKVGPASSAKIRVRNGKVNGSIVHSFEIRNIATVSGKTVGTKSFGWDIEDDGTWKIGNIKELNVGDSGDEPVVLGNQLVSMTNDVLAVIKDIIGALREFRQELMTTFTPIGPGATSAAGMVSPPTPVNNAAAIAALATLLGTAFTPLPAKLTALIAKLTPIEAANKKVETTYLTKQGVSKEKVLSDFFNTQKTAPTVGVVNE